MIAWLIRFFGARLVPIGAGVAAAVALVAWDYVRIERAEQRGEDRADVKTERNNAEVQELGRRGSDNDGKPVPGSVRDPGYRDEKR